MPVNQTYRNNTVTTVSLNNCSKIQFFRDILFTTDYYYDYYYYYYVSCHRTILPGNSLEPTVVPTAQASSFTLQYFPYYV